jgi:hypothetical protein
VLTADHPVAPERPAGGDAANWTTLGALAVAPLGAVALSIWLSETIEPKPSRYLLPLVGLAGVVLIWTAAWAVLSRVFASSAHFERNLRIALLGIAGYWLFHNAMTAAAFGFAWRMADLFEVVGTWGLLGLLVFLHLRVIAPSRLLLKAAVAAGLAGTVIALHLVSLPQPIGAGDQQNLMRDFMPPALRMTALRGDDAFFDDVRRIKARLDQDRIDEPDAAQAVGEAEASD